MKQVGIILNPVVVIYTEFPISPGAGYIRWIIAVERVISPIIDLPTKGNKLRVFDTWIVDFEITGI